jgi:ketosteroid isomerase-like protein
MTPSEELMKRCIEAWGEGDLSPLRKALHDDVLWISATTEWDDRLRFGGVTRGRAEALAVLAKAATTYFTTFAKAKEIISSGEVVWGLFDCKARYVGNPDSADRTVSAEVAFRWRVRNGKILEAQAFQDTAGVLAQLTK